jgi:hypothetical protein
VFAGGSGSLRYDRDLLSGRGSLASLLPVYLKSIYDVRVILAMNFALGVQSRYSMYIRGVWVIIGNPIFRRQGHSLLDVV